MPQPEIADMFDRGLTQPFHRPESGTPVVKAQRYSVQQIGDVQEICDRWYHKVFGPTYRQEVVVKDEQGKDHTLTLDAGSRTDLERHIHDITLIQELEHVANGLLRQIDSSTTQHDGLARAHAFEVLRKKADEIRIHLGYNDISLPR